MKLTSLQFIDRESGLDTDIIRFDDKLTLLLGKSGSGKSLILNTIHRLCGEMSNSISRNVLRNIVWRMVGTTKTSLYDWKGHKSCREYIYESLFFKGVDYFKRDDSVVHYYNDTTRSVERKYSAITIPDIKDIEELVTESMYPCVHKYAFYLDEEDEFYEDSSTILLEHVQKSQGSIESKYEYLASINHSVIKDIRYFIESYLGEGCFIPSNLSIGFLPDGYKKLLKLVTTVYLSPSNSIILIDNIEDKLDVIYLKAVIELLSVRNDLQYVITTHHPYIINNISMKYWRLLAIKSKSTIVSYNHDDLGLGKSKHEAFIQLINSDYYS